MKMKLSKKFLALILLIVFLVGVLVVIALYREGGSGNGKLRICPDSWIVNNMPRTMDIGANSPNQYFIIDGKRIEVDEVDTDWVTRNCDVRQNVVY